MARLFLGFAAFCCWGLAIMVALDYAVPEYDRAEEAAKSIWFVVSGLLLSGSATLALHAVVRISATTRAQLLSAVLGATMALALFGMLGASSAERPAVLTAVIAGGLIAGACAHWGGRAIERRAAAT